MSASSEASLLGAGIVMLEHPREPPLTPTANPYHRGTTQRGFLVSLMVSWCVCAIQNAN
jgi:hypothetical protein